MPIGLDPDQVVEIVLSSDEEKAAADRPVFLARYCSIRQHRKAIALVKAARETESEDEEYRLIAEAAAICLTGWRNLPIPFEPSKLPDILTPVEFWELATKMLEAPSQSEINRKNSRSGGSSDTASAVAPAPPANATNSPPLTHLSA